MAYDHCVRSEKYSPSDPNHPDLVDPYRELRKLVRPMRPEEENQRSYDFGNVNQRQLAVDGYASKAEAAIMGGARPPTNGERRMNALLNKKPDTKSNKSQATKPDGWQTFTQAAIGSSK